MPTLRLRSGAEYSGAAQKPFELSRAWCNHEFAELAGMSRVMAWEPEFGRPHGRAAKRATELQLEPDMGDIAPVDPTPAPGGPAL